MIGIFDSGSGGLTVLQRLRDHLPMADIVYFGDIKHAPYGNRTREDLRTLTMAGFSLLARRGATEFVSACNSISPEVNDTLLREIGINDSAVIEMSRPTIRLCSAESYRQVLIVATKATVDSRMYQDGLAAVGIGSAAIAIPHLAGAIERGAPDSEILEIIRPELFGAQIPFDALLLGCTHFPFVQSIFEDVLTTSGINVPIIDPAVPVALAAFERFSGKGGGVLQFILSNDSAIFRARVESLFRQNTYTIEVIA